MGKNPLQEMRELSRDIAAKRQAEEKRKLKNKQREKTELSGTLIAKKQVLKEELDKYKSRKASAVYVTPALIVIMSILILVTGYVFLTRKPPPSLKLSNPPVKETIAPNSPLYTSAVKFTDNLLQKYSGRDAKLPDELWNLNVNKEIRYFSNLILKNIHTPESLQLEEVYKHKHQDNYLYLRYQNIDDLCALAFKIKKNRKTNNFELIVIE